MKYEGLTQEFVDFIDDYKIAKVNDLIKKVKDHLKEMDLSEEIEVKYTNILEHFSIDELANALEKELPRKHPSLFSSDNKTEVHEWKNKLSDLKEDWQKEQEKTAATTIKKQKDEQECYRVQSLKTSISTKVKNLLKTKESYEKEKDNISRTVKRMLNLNRLCYDLEERLHKIKETIPQLEQSLNDHQKTWLDKLKEISDKYDYANWLDWASKNAGNISFSTHVAKLTHSNMKGASSIYFETKDREPCYFSTSSLQSKIIDVSQTDNKFAPIGKFLNLKYNDIFLADNLNASNLSDIKIFDIDGEQLAQWQQGFLNAFKDKQPSSHSLAKQVYYPVKNKYHLLSPYASSSLDQIIYERITHYKFDEQEKEVREHKRNKKYHPTNISTSYPNIVVLKVTSGDRASKAHMNVSPLNMKRYGQRFLFTSAPPHWETSLKPPIRQKSLFYGEFDRRAWHLAKDLQKYLLELQGQKSNKVIRDQVKDSVNKIIDALFSYVGGVQRIEGCAGWSEQAEKLEKSHKLWLDPYRDDEAFQTEREKGDWQKEVCQDFGGWMNKKLKHKKMQFSNIEAVQWAKLLKGRLREFERDLEVSK